jgi:hypothetical protein
MNGDKPVGTVKAVLNQGVCVCVCVCVCFCTLCMHVHVCLHVCTFMQMCVSTYTGIHVLCTHVWADDAAACSRGQLEAETR